MRKVNGMRDYQHIKSIKGNEKILLSLPLPSTSGNA